MRVQLEITNEDDCQWLETIPKEKRSEVLRNCITIGRLALENSKISINNSKYLEPIMDKFRDITNSNIDKILETINYSVGKIEDSRSNIDGFSKEITCEVKKNSETMIECLRSQSSITEKLLDPITSRIDQVNTQLEKIFSVKSSSNTKGKLGESIIENHISNAFSHYGVYNMSQTPHEADYHIQTDYGKVLLEIKTYTHSVNKDQIEKFYNDIERTGIQLGIFLSTTSGIVGKPHIEWELHGTSPKAILLFFPNSSLSMDAVVFSFLFLKALVDSGINKQSSAITITKSNEEILELFKMFDDFYKNLLNVVEKQSKLKYQIQIIRNSINKSIDELYKQCFDLELELTSTIDYIYSNLKDRMIQYECPIENYSILDSHLEIEKVLQSLSIKPTQIQVVKKLFSILQELKFDYNIYIDKEKNKMVVLDTSRKIVFHLVIQKTKLDVLFDIPKESSSISFNPKFETYKNSQIILSLENDLETLEYLRTKLIKNHATLLTVKEIKEI
jgi:hypothetical protein